MLILNSIVAGKLKLFRSSKISQFDFPSSAPQDAAFAIIRYTQHILKSPVGRNYMQYMSM